jgi:hypothetical protein
LEGFICKGIIIHVLLYRRLKITFVSSEIRGFIRVLNSSRKFVIVILRGLELYLGAVSGVGKFYDWLAVAWA